MATFIYKNKDIKRKWHLIDASNRKLGRLSVEIASLISGKGKIYYSPHQDLGDFVVVINAKNIKVTGKKIKNKIYYHYSGYPGGLKSINYENKFKKDPKWIIKNSVKGMLPLNRLKSKRLNRLKIYLDDEHPYKKNL